MRGKKIHRLLSILLVVVMLLSVFPGAVLADNATSTGSDGSTFYRIFHLDCGRKYFSVSEIKGIIDELAENNYTHLQLAFGNDALRFLLDDMSVTANGTNYASDAVKRGIQAGNQAYYNFATNELTETEMDEIIAYAASKDIEIIPLLNTPGHMTVLLSAMNTLGISSNTSLSFTDTNQVAFVQGLLQKYITYFSGKCQFFNMGADEYHFSSLDSTGYASFVTYVNQVAAMIKDVGMTPIAFNDGIYYNSTDAAFEEAAASIDNDIVVAYWTNGTNYAPTATLAEKGFELLNNNNSWYYVMGDALYDHWAQGQWGYQDSKTALQNVSCTTVADGSNVPVVGSVLCVWCDYPGYPYESDKVHDLIATMADSNPTYFATDSGETDPEPGDPSEVKENKTIIVTVGGTQTDIIEGTNYAGNYDTEDTSIATVVVTGENETAAQEPSKVSINPRWNNLINEDGTVATNYYYRTGDGTYHQLYAARESSGWIFKNYSYTLGYYQNGSSSLIEVASGTKSNERVDSNVTLYIGTAGTPASTTVTFTGHEVGTTYVTVGNIRYTINVVAEDLSGVADLPIQLWITNSPITVQGFTNQTTGEFNQYYNGQHAQYMTIKAESAYGIDGVKLASLVPTGVMANNTETENTNSAAKYVLWKGTVLNKTTTGLQGVWDINMCNSGSDFAYVRYYDGKWAVSADRLAWTTVTGNGSTIDYYSCTEQVIAYYMQRTEITDQVITDMVDGGDILSQANNPNDHYVILDYAVNANGTLIPDTFPQDGKTLRFHCVGGGDTGEAGNYRRLNAVMATETSSYEVYMITITPTTDNTGERTFDMYNNPSTINYEGTERVIWAKTEGDIPDGKATIADEDYTTNRNYGSVTYGGEPVINELNIYSLQGMLVTYYVRGLQTEDSLTVSYVDDTNGNTFYTANFAVLVEEGKTKNFNNSLLDAGGNAYVVPGNATLKDNAYYIIDPYDAKIYVRTDLTKIPDLHGVYTTGIYSQVKAEIDPTNSKNLILHYTFDPSAGTLKNFVIDFGLPVTVTVEELLDNVADITSVSVKKQGTYGTSVSSGTTSFIYTPNKVLLNTDVVTITVTYKDNTQNDFRIGFVPASNVLYEDTFLSQKDSSVADLREWVHTGDASSLQQSSENTLYGYDVQYAASKGNSMESYWTVSNLTSGNGTKFLTTSFYGNGFDLIGTVGPDTGFVYLVIQGQDEGLGSKLIIIDTSYSKGTLYQVPLAHEILPEGNYTANIRATYRAASGEIASPTNTTSYSARSVMTASDTTVSDVYSVIDELFMEGFEIDDVEFVYFDESSSLSELNNATSAVSTFALERNSDDAATTTTPYRPEGTTVTIDGFRVYRNSEIPVYLDEEQGVSYTNVMKATLNGNGTFTAYVEDTDGKSWTQANYEANGGPQNEVYLGGSSSADAIAFKVISSKATVQISARAVGTDTVKLTVNGTMVKEIMSNTEMYYEVPIGEGGIVTIQNTGNGLLALGNLKLDNDMNTVALTADDEPVVFAYLRMMPTPEEPDVEPDPVFEPEKLDVKAKRVGFLRNKLVTVTITASTNVARLTVNGKEVKPTNSLSVRYGLSRNYVYVISETLKKTETKDYVIVAYDSNGVASEPVTVQG